MRSPSSSLVALLLILFSGHALGQAASPSLALCDPSIDISNPRASPANRYFISERKAKCANTGWFFKNLESDTVFVFVHGLGSDNLKTWMNERGSKSYWPDLVLTDSRYGTPSIFLAGYPTEKLGTSQYNIRDAANALRDTLSTPQRGDERSVIASHKTIVFVAHSMGGIVVRHMLSRPWNIDLFREKKIGLALIASPTFGSKAANIAEYVAQLLDIPLSTHATELRWQTSFLLELFEDFQFMRDRNTLPYLAGLELVEDGRLAIVPKESGGRFFSGGTIAGSDHFTIAAPSRENSDSANTRLLSFYLQRVKPIERSKENDTPVKRIVLMDSYSKIYNSRPGLGEMNSHVIRGTLAGVSDEIFIEPVHENWNDQERIAMLKPDLVIVHHSAFNSKAGRNLVDLKKLIMTVMQRQANTRFIVYGRGEDWTEGEFAKYVKNFVDPGYRSRIIGYHVKKHGEAEEHFDNPVVARELRELAIRQLTL